jgi:hypothetical protein
VNTTYCDANTTSCPTGSSISGFLKVSGTFLDLAEQGSTLNNNAVTRILQYAIAPGPGKLPADNNAIYVLITDDHQSVWGPDQLLRLS